MITTSKERAIELAREYRSMRELNRPECSDYLVVILESEIVGYNYSMRYASSTPPGTISVDMNNHVFLAVGCKNDNATHWIVME